VSMTCPVTGEEFKDVQVLVHQVSFTKRNPDPSYCRKSGLCCDRTIWQDPFEGKTVCRAIVAVGEAINRMKIKYACVLFLLAAFTRASDRAKYSSVDGFVTLNGQTPIPNATIGLENEARGTHRLAAAARAWHAAGCLSSQ
jgi:hypothetical protein